MKYFLLYVAILWTVEATAHSGGTDANGCHAGSQPYHCHGGSDEGEINTDALLIGLGVVVVISGLVALIWWGASINSSTTQMTQPPEEGKDATATLPFIDIGVGEDSGALRLGWRW
jgi:hypothetical protein